MFQTLPIEIRRLIYQFDSTYSDEMRYVHMHIKKLPTKENYIDGHLLMNILDLSSDAMIVSDSAIVSTVVKKKNSSIDSPLYSNEMNRLNDGANIILDSYSAMVKLLRSNLLREYDLDGWGIEIY